MKIEWCAPGLRRAADRRRGCGALGRGSFRAFGPDDYDGTEGTLHKRFPSQYGIQV
jgi:hypothetical protein